MEFFDTLFRIVFVGEEHQQRRKHVLINSSLVKNTNEGEGGISRLSLLILK